MIPEFEGFLAIGRSLIELWIVGTCPNLLSSNSATSVVPKCGSGASGIDSANCLSISRSSFGDWDFFSGGFSFTGGLLLLDNDATLSSGDSPEASFFVSTDAGAGGRAEFCNFLREFSKFYGFANAADNFPQSKHDFKTLTLILKRLFVTWNVKRVGEIV